MHRQGFVPSGKVYHRMLNDANEVVEGHYAILIIGNTEEQWREDLMEAGEVMIFWDAEDG